MKNSRHDALISFSDGCSSKMIDGYGERTGKVGACLKMMCLWKMKFLYEISNNSLVLGICGCNLKLELIWRISIWSISCEIPHVCATRPHWWLVNFGPGNGLVPPGTMSYKAHIKDSHGMGVFVSTLRCVLQSYYMYALQWRHNGRDGVSNDQPPSRLLNRLFRYRSRKTSKLRITGLCAGNSPVTDEHMLRIKFTVTSCEIALGWMPLSTLEDKSTLGFR